MIFNKEETRNLLNMLRSPDEENAVIAFESLNNVDTKKYIGELILLYKFGKHSSSEWEETCPKIYPKIKKALFGKEINEHYNNITTGDCLSAMTASEASMHSIELFMEIFTENMIGFLGQMGYPVDKFDVIVKLKDGQSTKS
jgi:hypothetical protein